MDCSCTPIEAKRICTQMHLTERCRACCCAWSLILYTTQTTQLIYAQPNTYTINSYCNIHRHRPKTVCTIYAHKRERAREDTGFTSLFTGRQQVLPIRTIQPVYTCKSTKSSRKRTHSNTCTVSLQNTQHHYHNICICTMHSAERYGLQYCALVCDSLCCRAVFPPTLCWANWQHSIRNFSNNHTQACLPVFCTLCVHLDRTTTSATKFRSEYRRSNVHTCCLCVSLSQPKYTRSSTLVCLIVKNVHTASYRTVFYDQKVPREFLN